MNTFNPEWIPSPTTRKRTEPRIRKAEFNDGYKQKTKDGINNAPERWDVVFESVNRAEIEAIEQFLIDEAGANFLWTSPATGATQKVYECNMEFSNTYERGLINGFRCVFEQVFVAIP